MCPHSALGGNDDSLPPLLFPVLPAYRVDLQTLFLFMLVAGVWSRTSPERPGLKGLRVPQLDYALVTLGTHRVTGIWAQL